LVAVAFYLFGREEVYIGLVGPMSGKSKEYGKSMRQAMDLLVDQINDDGGIDGRRVELIVKNDKGNEELAKDMALEFVKQDQVSLVIGHYFSSASIEAQSTYKDAHIPVITPSATSVKVTRDSEWMFSVTFDDEFQGAFLANYAKRMMLAQGVIIIHVEDPFGIGLANSFENTAPGLGLEVAFKDFFKKYEDPEKLEREVKAVVSRIPKNIGDVADLIFIAASAPEAAEIVLEINRQGIKLPILGPDSFGGQSFTEKVGKMGDGIRATIPLLFDSAGEKARIFIDQFRSRYDDEPDWQAAFTYDAGLLAIEALKTVPNFEKDRGRDKIKQYLERLDSAEKAVIGVTGANFFPPDRHGSMRKPPAIGKMIDGDFISIDAQLVPADSVQAEKLKKDNRLFIIDEIPFVKTQVVYTGFEIIDILSFDEASGNFVADFYLWFRWNAKDEGITSNNIANFEFTNGRNVKPVNLKNPETTNKEKERTEDSSQQRETNKDAGYLVFRVTGKFQADLDLREYPFDTQVLKVELRHKYLSRDRLVYVRDNVAIVEDSRPKLPHGWELRKPRQYAGSRRLKTSLGDPDYLDSHRAIDWATYGFALPLKRNYIPVFVKLLIPLIIIVSAAFVSFWLSPQSMPTRAAIAISTLLSGIVLHLTQNLPSVGYVVTADKLFFLAYFMILASLVESTTVYSLSERKKPSTAKRVDNWSRYAAPVVFVLGLLAFSFSVL
jgi:branched-chain amino acid transport system substrate-binding protein